MPKPRRLVVFVASPSDTGPERARVQEAIDRLTDEFGSDFVIDSILYEVRPLHAAADFQEQIPDPAETDVVVVIFWWHLGTILDDAEFVGPLSGERVTGTQWEFERAITAYEETRKPHVMVFFKTMPPAFENDEEVKAYRAEKERVERFQADYFRHRASYEFRDEKEFAEQVFDLLHAYVSEQWAQDRQSGVPSSKSPFRGLGRFNVEDAAFFHGRTHSKIMLREKAEVRSRSNTPWVLVTGASGSGKSSLVCAGLVPDVLKDGMVRGVRDCRYVIVRPSDRAGDPVGSLMRALLGDRAFPELRQSPLFSAQEIEKAHTNPDLAGQAVAQGLYEVEAKLKHDSPLLVVVVDQLEELFELPPEPREMFVRALDAIASNQNVWVIATMRSDVLDRLEEHEILAQRFDPDGRVLLSSPRDAELREIVVRRAQIARLSFEVDEDLGESLDERILADVRSERSLPLLENLLEQLWQRRTDEGLLTFEAYRELGGLAGAIAKTADAVLEGDQVEGEDGTTAGTPREQELRVALTSMARLDARDQWVKLPRKRSEIPRHVRPILARLTDKRLLVSYEVDGEAMYEVAHAELFKRWERLHEWLDERVDDFRLLRQVDGAARGWSGNECDPDLLWKGTPLDRALELRDSHRLVLTESVSSFIRKSEELRKVQNRKRLARRVAASALVFLIGVAAVVALRESRRARRSAEERKATELAVASSQLANQSLDRALLLAAESYQRRPVPEAQASLVSVLTRLPALQRILHGHEGEVRAVAVAPDGSAFGSAGTDGAIVIWASDGTATRTIEGHEGAVHGLTFNSTGSVLVSSSDDGTVRRWDPLTGEQIGAASRGHEGQIRRVEVDPGDRWIASAGHDSTVRVWSLETGAEVARFEDHTDLALDVAFSTTGAYLATTGLDGFVFVYRTADLQQMARIDIGGEVGGVRALDFHPVDEAVLAVGDQDGRVSLWNVEDAELIRELQPHEERVFDVAFDAAGDTLASAGRDQHILLHDLTSDADRDVTVLDGHAGDVRSVAFLPDGQLVSGSRDTTVMLWDPSSDQRLMRSQTPDGVAAVDVEMTPDGPELISVGTQSGDSLLLVGSPTDTRTVPLAKEATRIGYSPSSDEILIGNRDGTLTFVDAESLTVVADGPSVDSHEVSALAVAPDADVVATGHADGRIILWDPQRHDSIAQTSLGSAVRDLTFDHQGGRLFAADVNGAVWTWASGEGNDDPEMIADNRVRARQIAMSSDGELVVGTRQNQVQVWRLGGEQPVVTNVLDHPGDISDIAVSPAGRIAATSADADTLTMWELDTGRSLGSLGVEGPDAVAISSSSPTVAVAAATGVEVWNLDPKEMVSVACDVANRNLSEAEWDTYVGGTYRSTCPTD